MQNTGSNRQPPASSTTETGLVEFLERKETRAGKPMLTIKINQKDVSFFEEIDVQKEIAIGDQIQFQCTVKGQYFNGKALQCIHKGTPNGQDTFQAKKVVVGSTSINNTHDNPIINNSAKIPNISKPLGNVSRVLSINKDRFTLQIHNLNSEQLVQLYNQLQAEGESEPAFLGQISNQIRYARIEEMLKQLIGLSMSSD